MFPEEMEIDQYDQMPAIGNYVTINRKILNWEWYKNVNTFKVFIHLILKANWKAGRFEGIDIPRGSLVTSIENLAFETGLSVRNVRTALDHLENTGEVTTKGYSKFTVIVVNNYDIYQAGDRWTDKQLTNNRQTTDKQPTSNRQATDKQSTTIEKGNNGTKKSLNNGKSSDSGGDQSENSHVFMAVKELYNTICISFPRLVKISEARKKAIRARLNSGYSIDDFKQLFMNAEASEFLKGKNNSNWCADFDWLIKDANMAKVLEDKYINKKGVQNGQRETDETDDGSSVQIWS